MSCIHKGILGVVAIAATFGAAQFASGEDLTVGMRTAGTPDQGVNRAAKTDRAAVMSEPVAPTKTISIHVDRVPDTSVLVRMPRNHEARGGTTPEKRSGPTRPLPRSSKGGAPITSNSSLHQPVEV